MKLAELQHFFARAVTTGNGPVDGVEDVFESSGLLTASARLAIYNRAYYYRLLDSLASVFSHTRRILGDSAFERIGLRYVTERPSDHPAVERVGRAFARYLGELRDCAELTDARERALLSGPVVQVAALEWARLCSLVAPDARHLAAATDIEPSAFPDSRLHFVPSLQLLELDPCVLSALAAREEPPMPETAEFELQAGAELRRVGVAVYRQGQAVRHEAVPAIEYQALLAAHAGKRVQEVCATFDTGRSTADAQQAFRVIAGWFSRGWLERGFKCDGDRDGARPAE